MKTHPRGVIDAAQKMLSHALDIAEHEWLSLPSSLRDNENAERVMIAMAQRMITRSVILIADTIGPDKAIEVIVSAIEDAKELSFAGGSDTGLAIEDWVEIISDLNTNMEKQWQRFVADYFRDRMQKTGSAQ